MIDETFKWFTQAELSIYKDKYICIVGNEVVSADEDPEIAYKEAKKKYPDKEIVLWKVSDERIYKWHLSNVQNVALA